MITDDLTAPTRAGLTPDEHARLGRIRVNDANEYEWTSCPYCGGELTASWLRCDHVYRWRFKCVQCGDLGWQHTIHVRIHTFLNELVRRVTNEDEEAA